MHKMKDSGVEWVGICPYNWNFMKGKYIFAQRSERGNTINLQLLSPTQKFGVIPQSLFEEITTNTAVKVSEKTDLNQFKTIHKGDYCISLRSFQGGFEYSLYEGVVSPAYQVFYPIIEISDGYYKYLFKNQSFIDKINSYTMSLRDGKNIAFSDFGKTFIPVPPIEEQQKITSFLDRKCNDIDYIISGLKKQTETLEEYKKSLITETVTKGLNPDAKMKDSGVEWIGEIPEHWEVKRLKYLINSQLQYGANETGVEYDEKLPRYIRITDITSDNQLKENGKLSLPYKTAQPYLLKNNDILFARSGATVGKSFIYKNKYGACAFAGYLIKASIKRMVSPDFVYYYTLGAHYDLWKDRVFTQATIQNIGADKYVNLPVVVPPIEEQQKIADYLDKKCTQIDGIISGKKQQIKTMEEYKKSLIYEVVTGKQEV